MLLILMLGIMEDYFILVKLNNGLLKLGHTVQTWVIEVVSQERRYVMY